MYKSLPVNFSSLFIQVSYSSKRSTKQKLQCIIVFRFNSWSTINHIYTSKKNNKQPNFGSFFLLKDTSNTTWLINPKDYQGQKKKITRLLLYSWHLSPSCLLCHIIMHFLLPLIPLVFQKYQCWLPYLESLFESSYLD